MGRLFWKFFFFVWMAQLVSMAGVGAAFWWEHQQQHAPHGQAEGRGELPPPDELSDGRPPHGDGRDGDQPRPPKPPHRHRPFPPIEPLIAGFLVSLGVAALLARYFSRPIRTLRSAFDAAATGNLEVRIGTAMGGRRDELAELGQDFDRMATQLQALVEGQRRLLHDVSHELRSPLARLQATIDLARQQPGKLESTLERVEKESVRMDRLVGELLTLSRLEAGTAAPRIEEVDAAELLAGILGDARFEAAGKAVAVVLEGDGQGVIDGDGELLHRAIENVVRNAIRYSPPGSAVTVSTRADAAGQLHIAVLDNGPGVPPAELDAIFAPFFRSGGGKDSDGHGLGLAIAKRVVESLGGRIGGANRPEGGFAMEIVLPIRRPGQVRPSVQGFAGRD
ncbi:MAG TPA: ATP-binding protein [Rhodocyclaceae bacterium]|nr:ATP-binding protein [Rhodocyclaceae bacterium]